MKKQISAILLLFIISIILNGCSEEYELNFREITAGDLEVSLLERESIEEIVKEIEIDEFQIILYRTGEKDFIRGGLKFNGQIYDIGDVSMMPALEDDDLFSVDKIEVLSKNMLKIEGILGGNYIHSKYIYTKGNKQLFRLHVDGGTQEVDIDNDGIKEIVSTVGTVPETKIYSSQEGKIVAANINESINAKAVYLVDKDKKIFEVYFKPNKPKLFYVKDNSLKIYRN